MRRARPSAVVSLLGALMVGAALTLAGRFEFQARATVELTGACTPEQLEDYRRELLLFAFDHPGPGSAGPASRDRWDVQPAGGNLLELRLTSGSRSGAAQRALEVASGFCAKISAERGKTRETPGPAETVLAEFVTELSEKLDAAQRELDALVELPGDDPFENQKDLRVRWDNLRRQFNDVRERLVVAIREQAELEAGLGPVAGLVRSEDRAARLEADGALQQDLRELVVNLSEIKQFCQDVWRKSVSPLDQLRIAASSLLEVVGPSVKRAASVTTRRQADELVSACETYLEQIQTFAELWHQRFSALEKLDVDPYSDAILQELEKTRRLLGEFLYESGKQLASVREKVRTIGEDPSEDARHHVFLSNLTRAFQTVPAVHHRFEFAARKIEGPNNFRLDAAVTSAAGIMHRTQERIAQIEEALRAEALERERQAHLTRVAAAEALIDELRSETDHVVDTLLAIQKEINVNVDRSEAFSRAVLRMEVAAGRLNHLQAEMQRNQRRMRALAADRVAEAEATGVRLVGTTPVTGPENLRQRLGLGGLAAVLTFVTAMMGQWWIIRRTGPAPVSRRNSRHRAAPRASLRAGETSESDTSSARLPIRLD